MTLKGYFWLIGITLVIIFFTSLAYSNAVDDVTITVQEKERVVNGESSKYLIYTAEEVFENTDSFVFLKYDSSDLYKDLKVNHTYKVMVAGWRIKFLSSYRNIIKIYEEVKKE